MIDPNELHALADGELSAERSEELRQMLQRSEVHRRQLESIVALKTVIRSQSANLEVGDAWVACRARIKELDRAKATERIVGRYSWALCGVFFVAIVAGGFANRNVHRNSVSVSDFSRIATTIAPAQQPPAQDAARERWLDSLLGAARRSVDPNRLEIVGYAMGELDMRPVTAFYLKDHLGRVALLAMPGNLDLQGSQPLSKDGRFKVGHLGGQNCVVWSDGEHTWTVVGNRGYEDLVRTASILQQVR